MVALTDNDLYRCEECGLRYEDRKTAQDGEDFCHESDACNTAIIKESVDT